MDPEDLLEPRGDDEDAPSGENLEYDPAFIELELEAAGTEESVLGDKVTEAADPDYPEVATKALAVLERSHDLRAAIYYADDAQKQVAVDTIADVEASGLWPDKVVTEVEPVNDFWEAEPEHQDYLERFPNGYTCHFPRPNWVLPKRSATAAE